jgi:hypothetical protein
MKCSHTGFQVRGREVQIDEVEDRAMWCSGVGDISRDIATRRRARQRLATLFAMQERRRYDMPVVGLCRLEWR